MVTINRKSIDIDNCLDIIDMVVIENGIKITINDNNEHGLIIGDEVSLNKYFITNGEKNILTAKIVKVIEKESRKVGLPGSVEG